MDYQDEKNTETIELLMLDIPIIVALTGPMLLVTSIFVLQLDLILSLLIITFLGPFSIYLLNRISDIEEDVILRPKRAKFFRDNKTEVMVLAITIQIFLLIIGFMRNFSTGILLALPLLLSIFYNFKNIVGVRFKDHYLINNIVIGMFWGLSISLLPLAWVNRLNLTFDAIIVFSFITLKVFVDSIVADAKDVEADKQHDIQTIPARLTTEKTRLVLYVLNSITYSLIPIGVFLTLLPLRALILVLVYPYSLIISRLTGSNFIDPFIHANVYADLEYFLLGSISLNCIIF